MKKLPDLSCDLVKNQKKGFALVLALSLMSLVFLLVVSLVSLVGTELNLAELRKQKVLAQANARMGMMVALGEIQKHLGPDTRISATADILDERIESANKFVDSNNPYGSDSPQTPDSYYDLNENKTGSTNHLDGNSQFRDRLPVGQRAWTGVWRNRSSQKGSMIDKDLMVGGKPTPNNLVPGESINETEMYDSSYDPHPALEVAWLVSGNEGFRKLT